MSSHRRGPWSQHEDAYLCQLVHTQGALNWVRIAQLIGSRSPKQCRERYHQNLKPTLNHEPISPEEGLQIERMVGEMGKRWAEIARRLHGRSDNAVKNWWNGSMNRRRRLVLRRKSPSHQPHHFEERNRSLSFAMPVSTRLLTISSDYPPRNGRDGSLPSPAVSEASRDESVDGAPSLVSDSSSSFSISPRLDTSPGVELPPLNCYSREMRRPSLPGLPFGRTSFFPEPEIQSYALSSRIQPQPKPQNSIAPSPTYSRPEYYQQAYSVSAQTPRDAQFDSRRQLLTAPPTPVQLAPLQFQPRYERHEGIAERDSRMHLSALLG